MTLLPDENYNLSIKEPLGAGMQELVLLAGLLLLPQPNKEEACAKIRNHVSKAFHHFSEAEQELESRLWLVNSQSEGLIAVKKLLQDELQEKKGNVANLRIQIATLKEAEKKSQEMLEAAKSHVECTKEQLKLAHEEVAKNRFAREISIRLMALPGLRALIGVGMVAGYQAALKSAENLVAEAQGEVDKCLAEMTGYGDEIARFSQKEQEVQADIDSMEQRIPQIQAQCDELLALQGKVTQLQSQIRKCLSLLDLLAGKVHAAMVMSSHTCDPESLVDILEEIAGEVGGKDEAAIQPDQEIQALVLELNKVVQSLAARPGKSIPSNH